MPSGSKQRQIENEAVFRKANEKIHKQLDKLTKQAKLEGHNALTLAEDLELHFYCECSDENCKARIPLKLSDYRELHKARSRFIVIPNHETTAIEKVVSKNDTYNVVDKFMTPPERPGSLNSTAVNNV